MGSSFQTPARKTRGFVAGVRTTLVAASSALVAEGVGPAQISAQAEIPDGFEIVQIAQAEYFVGFPSINNCGEIAFDIKMSADPLDRDVFFYDNRELVRITDNKRRDNAVKINDVGTMTWERSGRTGPDQYIIVKGRNQPESVLDEHHRGLSGIAINNRGHIVWNRFRFRECPLETELMLWDGEQIRHITPRDNRNDQSPDMNELGWITWGSSDECANPWTGEIHLYRDGGIEVLWNDTRQPQVPAINNLGQVVWKRTPGLMIWQGGTSTLLSSDAGDGKPALNNLGDIYFWRWHDDIGRAQPWLYLVSNGEPRFYRLADDQTRSHGVGDINDWGEVGWAASLHGLNGALFLMRRLRNGDSEFDGDIDLDDYRRFADCMSGPLPPDRLCNCRFLDLDSDGDVDLHDVASFQRNFEGQ